MNKMKKLLLRLVSVTMSILMVSSYIPAIASSAADSDSGVLFAAAEPAIYKNETYSYAERAADMVARMTLAEKASQTAGYNSSAIPRLGVSAYMWWNEAHHGLMQEGWLSRYTTAASYPTNYAVGATWEPELFYDEAVEIGANTREQVRDNMYNLTMFSPTINLARDPRWGRNDEVFSEDPLLTGLMGASFVKGLEGKNYDGSYKVFNPNSGDGVKRVVTTIKHYMANNSERNRYTSGADNVTHREFREYYTRPARIIIGDADVSSVMMAYSSTNGIPISQSSYYMDTVLRQYYGFSGYIVTDCDSVAVSYNRSVHRFSNPHTLEKFTLGEAFANSMADGLDLQCNAGETDGLGSYASNLQRMLHNEDGSGSVVTDKGKFTEQQLEVSVHRMMTARMQLGEFDEENEWVDIARADWDKGMGGTNVPNIPSSANPTATGAFLARGLTEKRLELAQDVNRASVVMVKNRSNTLPITQDQIMADTDTYKVGVIGAMGINTYGGNYTGTLPSNFATSANYTNIEKGVRVAFANTSTYDAAAQNKLSVQYHYGYSSADSTGSLTGLSANNITFGAIRTYAALPADLDLAVVVVGNGSGESRESGDRTNLNLAAAQVELVRQVKSQLNPKKIVLIIESVGQVDIPEDALDVADAILWSCYGGISRVGYGEVITGKTNPNGRLNGTWLRNMAANHPGMFNYSLFPEDGQGGHTYMYNELEELWPFGLGLSFSELTFAKRGPSLFSTVAMLDSLTFNNNITKDTIINVSFEITNTNNVAGKQVPQIYVVSPDAGKNNFPEKRLVGFKKVLIGANETVPVTIPIKATDLAFFNEDKDCYELPSGQWTLHVALSSDLKGEAFGFVDGQGSRLSETFTVIGGSIVEDPKVISAKPTQFGDDKYGASGAEIINGVSERLIFDMSSNPNENIIDPGLGITMANEKLYGKRVINNNPGYDIGVDPAVVNAYVKGLPSTSTYFGWQNPDVAGEAAIGRVENENSPKPQMGVKYELPPGYTVEFASNRPEVVAIEALNITGESIVASTGVFAKGAITMKAPGVATISAKVTNDSTKESATTDFIVYVKGAGLTGLTVGGTLIEGFEPGATEYYCVVPADSNPANAAYTVVGTPVAGGTVTYSRDGKNFVTAAAGFNPLSMSNTGGSDELMPADHKQNRVYIKVNGEDIAEQVYIVKFEEELSAVYLVGGDVDDKWNIVREDKTRYEAVPGYGLNIASSSGGLTGQFRHTTNLSAVGTRSYTNVFTRSIGSAGGAGGDGNWTMIAKITSPALPTACTPMILMWDDDDSWIRMNFTGGSATANKTAAMALIIGGQTNGTGPSGSTQVPGDPNAPFVGYYKIENKGGMAFTGFTSPDGLNWTQIRSSATAARQSESQYFSDLQLGLFMAGGTAGVSSVRYEFIDYSTNLKPKTDQEILNGAYAAVVDYLKTLDFKEILSDVKGNIVLPVPYDYAVKVETASARIKPDGTVTPPTVAENADVKISIIHPNAKYNDSSEYVVYDGAIRLSPVDFGVSVNTLEIDRNATSRTATFDVNIGSAARATVVSGTTTVATVATASAAFTANGTATITGVNAGTSNDTVTFYDDNGKILGTETVVVTVYSGAGASFDGTVSTESLSLNVNATTGNTFTVGLGSAVSAAVSSSNTNIATATLSGNTVTVNALNGGSAVITVSYYDGPNGAGSLLGTQRVTVTVIDINSLIGASSVDTASLKVLVGETKTFNVTIDNDAIQQVGISSDNTGIATVAPVALVESGEVSVTGVTVGNTTVEVKWWGMPNNVDLGVSTLVNIEVEPRASISVDDRVDIGVVSYPVATSQNYDPKFALKANGDIELTLIVAAYNARGSLAVLETKSVSLKAGESAEAQATIPKADGLTYKFFVWDSNFAPLTRINAF